jgi:hypothetical protein
VTVTPDDLALFLGKPVDDRRALKFIQLATDLAATVVSPLPDAAESVVLSMAARGYANPQGNTAETVGQWSGSGFGGIFLMSGERQTLRALAGAAGAFSVDTAPCGLGVHSPVCSLVFGASYCSCGADIAGFPLYECET